MENPSWFILKLFKGLICTAHSSLEWMALLASYCLTVSYYLLKLFSVVLVGVWEIKVFILDNLIPKLLEALNSIACNFLEWMALLASYCQNVSWYLLKLFSTILVTLGEIMVVIMDNLRMFIPKLFEALNSIVHSFSEWMALLASYSLNVSCYLLQLLSVVLAGVWEIMVVILDNLRVFIPKLFEALYSIARSFSEWMAFLASYSLNVSWYLLKLLSIILVRLLEIMVVVMDNLRIFIPKLFEALNSIARSFLEWMALLASCSFNVSCYLLKLLSVVLVGIWEIMVVILDNLHTFISMIFDTLISIRYWENSCAILSNLLWLISEIFEASNRLAQGCLEWIALLVSHCFISLCYLLNCFRVVLVSIWENMLSFVANIRMFMSMIFEELTSNGAINSENYWGNYSFIALSVALAVLCGAVIMVVLRKDSFGEAGHIHKEKPAALICLKFLLGKCSEGTGCPEHHCFLPYHWQYNVSNGVEWKSFSEKDNLALEKLYCDVNVERPVKFNPAQAIESDGKTSWKYELSIDVNSMTLLLEPTRRICAAGYRSGTLRRLTTPPRSTNPNHPHSTKWKWYWEDNGAVWCMYEKDHLGRNLQEMIEQAFLKGLKRNGSHHKFNFKVNAHEYYLVFHSKDGMHQVNMQYGTKRKVKRRPEGPVSPKELTVFKRTFESPVPTHWSYEPSSELYTRVTLQSSSWEFKEVEQLFKASMSSVVIKKIDRVQNLLMWKKFQRKKDQMTAIANGNEQRVNEKRLFHGTRPDSVEAICKENFDCRLSGSANGAAYGQGSYFAVNASLSHGYTQADANKSRFMFLVKVLAGSYVMGCSSYQTPPSDRVHARYYDSCVDNESTPTMFIVFDIDQHYPEYVIEYQSD